MPGEINDQTTQPIQHLSKPMSKQLFKHLLCATDLSEETRAVDIAALRLAASLKAHITFHHVDDTAYQTAQFFLMTNGVLPPALVSARITELYKRKETALTQRVRSLGELPLEQCTLTVTYGSPAEELRQAATNAKIKPDALIVAKKHHTRLGNFFLGTVANKMVSQVPCPTLLLPARPEMADWRPTRILVATALEAGSTQVEDMACALACASHGSLEVVYVMVPRNRLLSPLEWNASDPTAPDLNRLYEAAEIRMHERLGETKMRLQPWVGDLTALQATFLSGALINELAQVIEARKPDLVVIGQKHHAALTTFLGGTVAQQLIQSFHGSLFIVPHA